MVKNTPAGKVLDIPAVVSADTAAIGKLHEVRKDHEDRLAALESKAWSPSDVPTLEKREPKLVSVYDAQTPVGTLTSDTAAKKNAIYQSGIAAGLQKAHPE